MQYNKLVRDKIPIIIQNKGQTAKFHKANGDEFWQKLKEKLLEECQEFLASENEEELADIQEVLLEIMRYKKLDTNSIENIRLKKHEERGGFQGRIILEES
jgi:predicted house-cleaning noncanonical NTP pyrophosphatase (MazG superfamily)